MSERYHIYGGSGLLAFYFIMAMVIFISAGTFGEEAAAGIDFFTMILFGTLPAIALFRTIQFGYPGKEKGLGFVIGFFGAMVVMVIFNVFLGLSVIVENMLGGVIAAIAEEMFCRGFIYPILVRWSGSFIVAAMGSSSMWAILHVAAYGWNWMILAYIFAIGIVYSAAMEKAQSLDIPITVHVLNNVIVALGLFGGF